MISLEVTMPHNIGKMFYYGDRPWHKLGNKIDQPADLAGALSAGGLNWDVDLVPIVPAGEPNSKITQRMAVVRNDRQPGTEGRVIGVVHPGFVPLQNRDGAELFDSLLGKGERVYHTGGYLKNGEVVWLLAKLPKEIRLNGEDVIEPYLLFTNSHDGSIAIDIRLTTIRVVCNNTLTLALRKKQAADKVFRRAHNRSFGLLKAEAEDFYQFALKQCDETQALFAQLASKPCDDEAFKRYLLKLMPDLKKPATTAHNASVVKAWDTRMASLLAARKCIQSIRDNGIPEQNIPADKPNWWGALNTITCGVDHLQETESDRYAHSLLGSGDTLKSRALAMAESEVGQA
jgi:phage/plasmid-like protein (TIGR03299 family)